MVKGVYAPDGSYRVTIVNDSIYRVTPVNAAPFTNVDQITDSEISSTVKTVQTTGYYEDGDGGGALYKRVDSEPSHSGKFRSLDRFLPDGTVSDTDGGWWEIAEDIVNPKMFGAVFDGTTSDHAAWQAAIDWSAAKGPGKVIDFPPGYTLIDDELDFTGVTRVCIQGHGHRQSVIYVTPFGASKKLFKFPNSDTDTRPSEWNVLRDFEIQGRNTSNTTAFASGNHPIGVYMPYTTADRCINVAVRSLGNTAFWNTSANNTKLIGNEAFGCGHNYTKDDALSTGATFSGTAGSDQVTASAAVFNAGHVGKNFHLYGAGLSGFPAAHTITAVAGDGLSCTLDRTLSRTFSAQRGTLEGVAGAISSGSAILTLDTPVFTSADVGRYLYIEGAGSSGSMLVTTVLSVESTTQVTLGQNAITTVSNAFVIFAPGNYFGQLSKDLGDVRGLNDLVVSEHRTEGCLGADYIIGRGVNIWLNKCKSHGLGASTTRAGRNVRNFIFDGTRSIKLSEIEMDYGYSKDSGNILVCGDEAYVIFDGFTAGAISERQPFIDFKPDGAASCLILGNGLYNKFAAKEGDFIKFGAGLSWANVEFGTALKTREVSSRYDFSGPSIAKSYATNRQTIADDGIYSFVPALTTGILMLWSEMSTSYALVYFRATASPAAVIVAAGADVSAGTSALTAGAGDGVDGNTNIAVLKDQIIIKNRTAGTRFYRWAVLA